MKDIEQILRDNKPELPDEGAFLIETNARLSQVEGIKSTVDHEYRRGRHALIIALVAGLVLGCAIALLVTFYPLPTLEVDRTAFTNLIETLRSYRQYILIPIAALAIALSVVVMNKKQEAF